MHTETPAKRSVERTPRRNAHRLAAQGPAKNKRLKQSKVLKSFSAWWVFGTDAEGSNNAPCDCVRTETPFEKGPVGVLQAPALRHTLRRKAPQKANALKGIKF